jgi:hypothetical protein
MEFLSVKSAAQSAPGRPDINTIYRWCREGIRIPGGHRVKLKYIRRGGRIFTSAEWLEAFFEATTAAGERKAAEAAT